MSGMVELGVAAATDCGNEIAVANAGSVGDEGDNSLCFSMFFELLGLPSRC